MSIQHFLTPTDFLLCSQNQKLSVEHEALKAEHLRLKAEEAEKSTRLHELM